MFHMHSDEMMHITHMEEKKFEAIWDVRAGRMGKGFYVPGNYGKPKSSNQNDFIFPWIIMIPIDERWRVT